ncbi:glycosyl hydrolase family 28-related protein [Chryseobacterium mulctrae]|uniref:glycosyl hydrolase family 28-related protein n=1 Tax=Chryseobacterium mulctrae TaxID=2576777 RepID=UPI0011165619|nr:glycosyl hydrolase family 28-related protein [Chryseobacterium mulctrae]
MKIFSILFIFSSILFSAQEIVTFNDQFTGEIVSFKRTLMWENRIPITDKLVDNIIYKKNNGKYYKRNFSGPINIKWFNAKGDGVTDDTEFFLHAIKTLKTFNGGVLYIPKGQYKISKTLNVDFDNFFIQGEGSKNTVLLIHHNGVGINYKSKVADLSTARFNLSNIALVNKINRQSIPASDMVGTGIYCKEMHSSDWKDVYIENFLDALILDDSYLNIIINYFAQSNWRGIKTIGGSNGNTFYNGAQRNSSLDLRGITSEKNLFINMDIEPASNTQFVGNNNTFQNCRFERFNLLSKVYDRPWFVLGSDNKFTKCDWYWNFEDEPKDYMMIVEGNGNEIEISKTTTTAKLILLKKTSSNNLLKYTGEFNDLEITGSVRLSANLIQDLGKNNQIIYSNSYGVIEYLGSLSFTYRGEYTNYLKKKWIENADVNMQTLSWVASNISSPLGFSKDFAKRITVLNDKYVRRMKLENSQTADGKTKFAASAWVFIPKDFKGKYIAISIVEGQYISLDVTDENREKWLRVYGFALPQSGAKVQFCIDTDALKGNEFYIALPSLSSDLGAIAIYK